MTTRIKISQNHDEAIRRLDKYLGHSALTGMVIGYAKPTSNGTVSHKIILLVIDRTDGRIVSINSLVARLLGLRRTKDGAISCGGRTLTGIHSELEVKLGYKIPLHTA